MHCREAAPCGRATPPACLSHCRSCGSSSKHCTPCQLQPNRSASAAATDKRSHNLTGLGPLLRALTGGGHVVEAIRAEGGVLEIQVLPMMELAVPAAVGGRRGGRRVQEGASMAGKEATTAGQGQAHEQWQEVHGPEQGQTKDETAEEMEEEEQEREDQEEEEHMQEHEEEEEEEEGQDQPATGGLPQHRPPRSPQALHATATGSSGNGATTDWVSLVRERSPICSTRVVGNPPPKNTRNACVHTTTQ